MRVSEILERKPIAGVETVREQTTMSELVHRLTEKRIGAVVVVDAAQMLCGVISERDVIKGLAPTAELCLKDPVAEHMTREVVVAQPSDSAVSVLEKMTAGRFRHMPVLDNGALVGLVSIGDLVKHRIEMLQRDNEALEEFIRS